MFLMTNEGDSQEEYPQKHVSNIGVNMIEVVHVT